MRMTIRGALCVAALGAVAGCDEFAWSDPPTSDEAAYLALQEETLALRAATENLVATPLTDLPTTGTAQYDGTALIALDPLAGGAASELIGRAEITANFESATVSGQAGGFHGTVNGGDVTAFDGQVFLSQGTITRTGGDQIGADVNGTLQGGGDTVVVGGQVAGNFLGDPLLLNEPPPALSLGSDDATAFTVNGGAATGELQIIATN